MDLRTADPASASPLAERVPAIKNNCAVPAVADVSAVPDPGTGVAVHDRYSYQGQSGWLVFGGTFVAAPLVGGVYGLAHDASSVNYGPKPYSSTGGRSQSVLRLDRQRSMSRCELIDCAQVSHERGSLASIYRVR